MTNSAVAQAISVNAGQINYVTEHFQQLQRLSTAAVGASWTMIRLVRDLQLPAFWIILAGSTMGWVTWTYCTDYFPRYYRRRFGAIEQKPVPSKWGIFTQLFAFVAAMLAAMWLGSALRFEQLLLLAFSLSFVVTLSGMLRSREI